MDDKREREVKVLAGEIERLEGRNCAGGERMTKYRKMPVVIEAFQMTKERRWDNSAWPEWLHRAWNTEGEGCLRPDLDAPIDPGRESPSLLYIGTLEGAQRVSWDDWIIQGVQGEIYPCKPDIFNSTYEEVSDE